MIGKMEDEMSLTISLDQETVDLLDDLAGKTARTRLDVLKTAITAYADYDEWVRKQVEASLKEADAGNLIPDEVVDAEMRAYILSLKRDTPTNAD